MKLLTSEVYVDKFGRLTQAGWQALQGALDAQETLRLALAGKIAAAAAVPNASGGATVDVEARAQLAAIKAALT